MIVLHGIVLGLVCLLCATYGHGALIILLTPLAVAAICTVPRRLSAGARFALFAATAMCTRWIVLQHAFRPDVLWVSAGMCSGEYYRHSTMASATLYMVLELANLALCVAHLRRSGASDRWALLYAILPVASALNGEVAIPGALLALAVLSGMWIFRGMPFLSRYLASQSLDTTCAALVLLAAACAMGLPGGREIVWPTAAALVSLMGGASLAWLLIIPALAWRVGSGPILAPWAILVSASLWLLILVMLSIRGMRRWRTKRAFGRFSPAETISIVIPVLNESACIDTCVRAALHDACVCEVLVVDGGSNDATVQIAQRAGACVLLHDGSFGAGRGGHVRAGAHAARGDVLLILHADTVLMPDAAQSITRYLQQHRTVVGGALGSVFDAETFVLRWVEAANDLRAAFLGISFGDQVQFVRRDMAQTCDLAPGIPLMEDVEISLRMNAVGATCYLFGDARVSARAWRGDARKRAWLVIALVSEYLWLRSRGKPDVEAMYRRYYEGGTAK